MEEIKLYSARVCPFARRCLLVLFMLLCTLATLSHATDLQRARMTMDRYLAAQTSWQDNLAALLIKDKPEFTEIANAQRDHQHALISLKNARFNYLTNVDPQRLDTGELGRFTNFTWSETDTAAAKARTPGYSAHEEEVARTRSLNDRQPNWESFRNYFQTEFSRSEAFTEELARFQDELEMIKQEREK